MKLENHLIYIDITTVCGVGCDFCMYSNNHINNNQLVLTKKAKENLSQIINDKEVKRVSISGEGEPLNNIKAIKEILSLSKGGVAFELITSGYISHEKLIRLYDDIYQTISKNGDSINIRLSTDSYHISKVKHKPHAISIKYFLERNFINKTLSFRSIDTDRLFVKKYLISELKKINITSTIEEKNALEDILSIDGKEFKISYQNLVKPTFFKNEIFMRLEEYIELKSNQSQKKFTLGSLNKYPLLNGLDITIKPNGNVYFYGIEIDSIANIHNDYLDINTIKEIANENKLISKLYSVPFLEIIKILSVNDEVKKLIREVNNPYWIIKEIFQYNKFLLDEITNND
jgi:MoaA/NifB/PqqE/SkfB family radical SAM enzyme